MAGKGKAAISAEKQRAALGLDKDKNKDPVKDPVKTKATAGGASNHSKATAVGFYEVTPSCLAHNYLFRRLETAVQPHSCLSQLSTFF